jgi:hypothetical protein
MISSKFSILVYLALVFVLSISASAQLTPEMSINSVKLGDRVSGKAFLEPYSPTTDEKGNFAYFFYNDFGDKVWRLSVASFEDRFMIVEMEVFIAGKSYTKPHFTLKKVDHFITESGIFVGKKESLSAALLGDGIASDTRIGPKDLIKKKGEPTSRTKDGERETFTYSIDGVEITDAAGAVKKVKYSATYDFRDGRLRRFVIGIAGSSVLPA